MSIKGNIFSYKDFCYQFSGTSVFYMNNDKLIHLLKVYCNMNLTTEKKWFFDYCYAMTGVNAFELHNDTLKNLLNMYCDHKHWMSYCSTKFKLRSWN